LFKLKLLVWFFGLLTKLARLKIIAAGKTLGLSDLFFCGMILVS